MKTKHTPGPWKLSQLGKIKILTNIESKQGRFIATCGGFQNTTDSENTNNENEANAKLIILAPEMLETLEKLECWGAKFGMPYLMYEELISLISKAKGEL